MEASYLERHPKLRDTINFVTFVTVVIAGVLLINSFIFRSFSVSGHSMDDTLHDGERLIVNRLPVTFDQLKNQPYMPSRGQIIVFQNPRFADGKTEQYIVKRVIAFPGERVTIDGGVMKVYTKDHPDGYEYDADYRKNGVGPKSPVSGDGLNVVVPDGTIFVAGDNRIDGHSYDSRSGLGYIPNYDIVGPVAIRLWPFDRLSLF